MYRPRQKGVRRGYVGEESRAGKRRLGGLGLRTARESRRGGAAGALWSPSTAASAIAPALHATAPVDAGPASAASSRSPTTRRRPCFSLGPGRTGPRVGPVLGDGLDGRGPGAGGERESEESGAHDGPRE